MDKRKNNEPKDLTKKSEPKTKKFKKNSKKPREVQKVVYDPEEEARLQKLVFGDPTDVVNNLLDNSESDFEENDTKIEEDSDSSDESVIDLGDYNKSPKSKVAWKDEDDEDYSVEDALQKQNRKLPSGRPEKKYKQLLENKFAHVYGTPNWAKLDSEKKGFESDDSDNEILKHSNHIIRRKSKNLSKGIIDIKVLSDINKQTHKEGPFVNSVEFHKTSTVGLVAGSSCVLSLFEIDGKENNKLHTMKFERFPIHTARFLKDGTEIVVGSMSHAHCHSYDLVTGKTLKILLPHGITNMKKFEVSPDGKIIAICGRLGDIYLLSSTTKELIGSLKMNKKCRSVAFTPDGEKLLSHGESNEIYVWDLNSRTCLNRAFDDGCLSSASIAVSPNGQYVATGSKQGVVNIYDSKKVFQEKTPEPLKIILNLITSITKLKFNPTSELLAMASDQKQNAFKMVHLPSFNVYSNFPTFNTQMHNPLDIDFSPGSGYMSVTNNKGFAYLYRLKHFGNY